MSGRSIPVETGPCVDPKGHGFETHRIGFHSMLGPHLCWIHILYLMRISTRMMWSLSAFFFSLNSHDLSSIFSQFLESQYSCLLILRIPLQKSKGLTIHYSNYCFGNILASNFGFFREMQSQTYSKASETEREEMIVYWVATLISPH